MSRRAGTLALLFGLLGLLVTLAAPASAEDPLDKLHHDKHCLIVPEDAFGALFSFYCADDGKHGVWKHHHGSAVVSGEAQDYVNGGLGDCADNFDDKAAADVADVLQFGSGGSGTWTECVKRRMKDWLSGKSKLNNNFASSSMTGVENPCDGIYTSTHLRDQCRSPVGQNPCLFISQPPFTGPQAKENDMLKQCKHDHPGFMQTNLKSKTADDPCSQVGKSQKADCKARAQQDASGYPVDTKTKKDMNELLGWLLLGTTTACGAALLLASGGMALAWYSGHPAPFHVMRLGRIALATLITGSASGVTMMVLNL